MSMGRAPNSAPMYPKGQYPCFHCITACESWEYDCAFTNCLFYTPSLDTMANSLSYITALHIMITPHLKLQPTIQFVGGFSIQLPRSLLLLAIVCVICTFILGFERNQTSEKFCSLISEEHDIEPTEVTLGLRLLRQAKATTFHKQSR
jgi:hypothetical protein